MFARAAQRNISPGEIVDCLEKADITYPGNTKDPRTIYQYKDMKAVVVDQKLMLLTVMWRGSDDI